MRQYILRRLLLILPVLWGASLFVFLAIRVVPGDVILARMQEAHSIDAQLREHIVRELGLDVPLHVQYWRWLSGVVTGDLGLSLISREPVSKEISRRIPISAEVAALALVVAVLIAIPLGTLSAVKQDTWVDYVARLLSIFWLSVPNFVIGTAIIMIPALLWRYSAPLGFPSLLHEPAQNLEKIMPAALALGALLSGVTTRMTRSTALEVLREDYIRTARAKGLAERIVILRHALRNALIPVFTIVGDQFAALLGGTVIVETIFGIPGLGTLALTALRDKDYTMIQGVTLFFAFVHVVTNLTIDLVYAWFDPRIRYS